jgi:hypothetical protein
MTRDHEIGAGRRLSQAKREEQSRQRRAGVLALPMVPVRLRGYLRSPDGLAGLREPAAAGVGFDGAAWAAWRAEGGDTGVLVTSHQGSGPATAQIQVPTSLRVRFVQPLPGGQVLIVAARTPPGQDNAEIWSGDGRLERSGLIGDAVEHVLTTASGKSGRDTSTRLSEAADLRATAWPGSPLAWNPNGFTRMAACCRSPTATR